MNYVIIGNSASGIAAIEAIREYDKKGKITVISDEPYPNYSRPLISYFLGKKVSLEAMSFQKKEFYRDNKVDLILRRRSNPALQDGDKKRRSVSTLSKPRALDRGLSNGLILNTKAKKLDIKKRRVILSDKRKIPFDKLLIATGGIPIVPEIKGRNFPSAANGEPRLRREASACRLAYRKAGTGRNLPLADGVFTFTKLDDVRQIEKYIKVNKVKKALVLGGGLIGLKATEALIALKIKVTIVELADRILSATFDRKASSIIEAALGKIGCKLIANNTVTKVISSPLRLGLTAFTLRKLEGLTASGSGQVSHKVTSVILKDKKEIKCDLVIIAIGVKPNIELVKNTPIKTNKGILVDNYMQTNIKNIYAAGDCCEAKDSLLHINRPLAIWPAAVRQGKIAGFNMAFGPRSGQALRPRSRQALRLGSTSLTTGRSGQAGVKKEYQGNFAMNSVELCGIPTVSVGESCSEKESCQNLYYFHPEESIYRKIVLKNGRIVGAIFVGDIERAGIYTGLIKDKVDVTSFKEYLLKEDFGLINLPKVYRKHLVAGEAMIIL